MAPSELESLRSRAAAEVAAAYRARDAAMDRIRDLEAAVGGWAEPLGRTVVREAELLRAADEAAALLWAMPEGTPHRQEALDALLAVLPDGTGPDGEDPRA